MLKKFLSYYKPHKLMFTLDMLSAFFVAVIGITYPIITRHTLNVLIPKREYANMVFAALGLLLLYLTRMLLNFFIQYFGHIIGVKMQAQMRSDMFNHLETLPFKFYDDNETGKIMSRMTNDLMDISELAHHGPETIIVSSVSVIISFIYLSTINIYMTLIIFACVPFLFIVTFILRKRMRSAFRESRKSIAEINASLESSITGIRVTKAFTNHDVETEKFEKGNSWFVRARKKAYKAMGHFHSTNLFITDVFNVIVLLVGGLFLYSGHLNFGDYSAFIVALPVFITPIMTLINFTEQFQNGATGFERFIQIMEEKPEEDILGAKDLENVNGDIEFNNVVCNYDGEHNVLKGVSFKIEKGKTFALVGSSGGGKTTICHLLPRFYPIADGEILIDGQNIANLTLSSLRKNIGIVQQDVFLFNASIKDNILYGRPDATDEEVIEASKSAGIYDYVTSLEDGFDTIIGERGVKLSGGQKQRIGIARVFLKNPPLLILDEATSALDNVTEKLVQDSLERLCKGRTTIVVAHRLSTVKNADTIAVIEDGVLVESGTHDELIDKKGKYYKLSAGLY